MAAARTWTQLSPLLEERLSSERSSTIITDVSDFESFQAALHHMCQKYSRRNAARLIHNKLGPHFDHIKSFDKALSTLSQSQPSALLLWGGTQIVLELCCRFSDHLDKTLDQLAKFYREIPIFDEDMELFPGNKLLELCLRDVFEDFVDFCVSTIEFVKTHPFVNIWMSLWVSSSSRKMRSVISRMEIHRKDFEKAATLAFRKEAIHGRKPRSVRQLPWAKSTIVGCRNRHFQGREELLVKLHELFSAPTGTTLRGGAISCLLHGLGGIGKTHAALEYSFRHAADYEYRFWVAAEAQTALLDSFGRIAARVLDEVPSTSRMDPHTIDMVRSWLETTESSWLLIFDNAQDWYEIEPHFPTAMKSRSAILVTSQVRDLGYWTTQSLPVESLTTEDVASLLFKSLDRDTSGLPQVERDAAVEISELLGGLPLAVATIAAYISGSRRPLSEYKELLVSRSPFIWGFSSYSAQQHERRLNAVWDLALEELSVGATSLIYTLAFLNPDAISESVIESGEYRVHQSSPVRALEKDELIDMTRSLCRRALVRMDTDGNKHFFTIHRSLQHALLLKLDQDPNERQRAFERVVVLLRRILPRAPDDQVPDPSQWPQFEITASHVHTLCNAFVQCKPRIPASLEFAQLLYDAAFYTWERDSHASDGIKLLTVAEEVLDELRYDQVGRLRADISCIMGLLLDDIGISKRVQDGQRRRQAYTIRDKIFESDREASRIDPINELLLYNAINDFGFSLLEEDNFTEAEPQFERCLAKYKEWGSESDIPFEYAKYFMNSAFVRMYQGRYEEARDSAQRSVDVCRAASGETLRYWRFRFLQACIALQAGDLPSSLRMHQETLDARIALCGDFSVWTLESLYTVGAMHDWMAGEGSSGHPHLVKAEKLLRLAVDRARGARWPREALGRAQLHLADIYNRRGIRLDEAKRLRDLALAPLAEMVDSRPRPIHLVSCADEMAMYDHLQPTLRAKFTGRKLLPMIQAASGIQSTSS
ncbi:hypothetical protein B0T19DRAFT_468446 [Cercophora scortea]|uniref:DUF7779 domain-containing protein n=1 Tax=Cercophora scortea TaxID=314031 RepID=A0AAE0M6D2_9PEZI|nr:hypothetical protein B0T19DRAFT_468446 [Cercophora scortea]